MGRHARGREGEGAEPDEGVQGQVPVDALPDQGHQGQVWHQIDDDDDDDDSANGLLYHLTHQHQIGAQLTKVPQWDVFTSAVCCHVMGFYSNLAFFEGVAYATNYFRLKRLIQT